MFDKQAWMAGYRKTYGPAYYAANKEEILARQKRWKEENRELYLQRRRDSNARCSARRVAAQRDRDCLHPEGLRARVAKRRAARIERTPPWFGELDQLVMVEAHDLARRRGGWHVDHKIPLQGRRVSGLHVWNNIQVIPPTANRRKSNQYET